MPSSRPNTIPTVIHLVRQLKPRSILDIGVGFGKWGHLFREYTDILEAEHDPARYRREKWQVRIDGIEGFADYVTEMHRYIYNSIFVGDARETLRKLDNYDMIFLGDILEHFEKQDGHQLLRDVIEKVNKAVILTTPKYETGQGDLCGNELERHRSLWSETDLLELPNASVKTVDDDTLLAVFAKSGKVKLDLTPPRTESNEVLHDFRLIKEQLERLFSHNQQFILVDAEQLRSSLPHKRVRPFLEKAGNYWGPPPDDAVAISELERLRQEGASHLVFIWTTLWWLEHYRQFAAYLHANYRIAREDKLVKIFEL